VADYQFLCRVFEQRGAVARTGATLTGLLPGVRWRGTTFGRNVWEGVRRESVRWGASGSPKGKAASEMSG